MKKDVAYKLRVAFNSVSSNLEYAVCGCPAGHRPKCTCKHLTCFYYFIEEFCSHGNINYAESTNYHYNSGINHKRDCQQHVL